MRSWWLAGPGTSAYNCKTNEKQQQWNYNLTDRLQNVLFLAHLGNPRMILVFGGDWGYAGIPVKDFRRQKSSRSSRHELIDKTLCNVFSTLLTNYRQGDSQKFHKKDMPGLYLLIWTWVLDRHCRKTFLPHNYLSWLEPLPPPLQPLSPTPSRRMDLWQLSHWDKQIILFSFL